MEALVTSAVVDLLPPRYAERTRPALALLELFCTVVYVVPRTAVTAAPSIEERSTRRSALPMVVPKPRSKGWAMKRP